MDAVLQGGSLPSSGAPPSSYQRGYLTSARRFPMPEMEESQFIVKIEKDTRQKLPVTDDEYDDEEEDEKKKTEVWVTLMLQGDRLVVVRDARSWEWRLGYIRRYGYSSSSFYFESGRKSRTGKAVYTFITDCCQRIHSRLTMVKEFCQFDLYCQRGVILDLLLVNNTPPSRVRSLKDKSERENDRRGRGVEVRRTSTGSLPF